MEEDKTVEEPNADDAIQEECSTRLQRKKLTKNRLIQSIDTALDLNNYNLYKIPAQEKTITGIIKVDRNRENDIHVKY